MRLQIIKDFLMKASFDFDRPDIDLYNFHPQLRIFLAVKGVFFTNRGSRFRLIWPSICIQLSIIGMTFEEMFIWRGVSLKDYSFATECFCYWLLLGCIPTVYVSILVHTNKIYDIVVKMNEEFIYVCSLGPTYRKPFLEGQLLIWQLCYAWFGFVSFVGGLYVVFPLVGLIYQSLFATLNENTTRPLQFPMWLPHDDPYRTPNYELFLLIQSTLCFCFVQTFCVYVYTLFHILLHYYMIMDMIIIDFSVIFDGLEESVALLPRQDSRRMETQRILNARIEKIVKWHLSVFRAVKTVSSIYGPPLVYQVSFTSIAICLIAYQIAEKLDHGSVDILFSLLSICACLQLWIPCHLGTMIRNKAFEVGDAGWTCGWHETPLGLMIRTDIIIIILRAQQPVTIKYTGLPQIQLETFSSCMSSSYSYFNMLRQYSK
ncbi:odorant receptor 13a-like isoform X1 [Spodoptera litura]|uniref:Odorant receptor n=2 Tax=Spodoptera litura TaxID=69820 RepID=A0A9J7EB57_SPOLT|nr:odorant receptor 13a-like isoform X1 [Spodoptera litura]